MAATASYWCYQCNRFVTVGHVSNIVCPHCDGGFVEAVDSTPAVSSPESRRRSPVSNESSDNERSVNPGIRRSRRSSNRGDRSPFNPVILLRSPTADGGGDVSEGDDSAGSERLYQLYYDDGAGTGLRPLPPSMSEFLLGSGFDRLLDQLSQLEINRHENPPASKAAIESMPTIPILPSHVRSDLNCAVCHEAFTVGSEAREMPCKHLYHSDCILPWLSIRNSCPICRHELPIDSVHGSDPERNHNNNNSNQSRNETEPIGLTIWRLPGGGYAVGRFSGARREGERELPVVYTEMDGGFNGNSNGMPRRIVWGTRRRSRGSGNGGMGRFFGNFASFFRRFTSSSSSSLSMSSNSSDSSSPGIAISRSRSISASSVFQRYIRRSR